jgi:hypothetical protein
MDPSLTEANNYLTFFQRLGHARVTQFDIEAKNRLANWEQL